MRYFPVNQRSEKLVPSGHEKEVGGELATWPFGRAGGGTGRFAAVRPTTSSSLKRHPAHDVGQCRVRTGHRYLAAKPSSRDPWERSPIRTQFVFCTSPISEDRMAWQARIGEAGHVAVRVAACGVPWRISAPNLRWRPGRDRGQTGRRGALSRTPRLGRSGCWRGSACARTPDPARRQSSGRIARECARQVSWPPRGIDSESTGQDWGAANSCVFSFSCPVRGECHAAM